MVEKNELPLINEPYLASKWAYVRIVSLTNKCFDLNDTWSVIVTLVKCPRFTR